MSMTRRQTKGSRLTVAEFDATNAEAGWQGADLASAASVDLGASEGSTFNITGTTAIASFGTTAQTGARRTIIFASAGCQITHGTGTPGIRCPGGFNWTSKAGDVLIFEHRGSGVWQCVAYAAADYRLQGFGLPTFQWYDNGNWSGAVTLDFTKARHQKATLTGNVTGITLVGPASGLATIDVDLYQDATGGRTCAMPATFKWPAAYASGDKTLSTAGSAWDMAILKWYDSTHQVANLMKAIA